MRQQLMERQSALTSLRRERDYLQNEFQQVLQARQTMEAERDALSKQYEKEQQDVVKLSSFSVANKWKEWTGKWDTQMAQEIHEVAEVERQLQDAERQLAKLQQEEAQLQNHLDQLKLRHIDHDWEQFLEEKKRWLQLHDEKVDAMLRQIVENRLHLHALRREISEAYDAGEKAIHALSRALKKLNSAEGYSIWDTFLGGGLIASALKHSEIDSSKKDIQMAQRALQKYEAELMDVKEMATKSFDVHKQDLITFTDLFMDNIFSDWAVHSRIQDAKSELFDTLQEVRAVQEKLLRKKEEAAAALEQLEKEEQHVLLL